MGDTILDTLKDGTQTTGVTGTIAVTGGLTDAELRATPVVVTVSGAAPGLTDTELRASPVPVSGTVTANAGTGTMAVSAASLPLPSGASTSANQPALGTAGTASSDVLTVQGIASMTAIKVDGSAVTQPVSGTVTANTGLSQPLTDTQLRNSAVPVSGAFYQVTQPVSISSLPIPSGAATETTLSSVNTRLTGGTTGTITSVAANVASVTLKASNASRKQIYLFNESTQICYVAFASSSSATAYTIKMAAQSLYVGEYPFYSGIITGIWAAADGSGNMRITEVT